MLCGRGVRAAAVCTGLSHAREWLLKSGCQTRRTSILPVVIALYMHCVHQDIRTRRVLCVDDSHTPTHAHAHTRSANPPFSGTFDPVGVVQYAGTGERDDFIDRSTGCASSEYPGPADAKFQSCDVVQIELAPGWDNGAARVVPAHCADDPAKQCLRDADCASSTCSGHSLDNQVSGNAQEGRRKVCESTKSLDSGGGALKCFYKETFAEEMTGEYAVRCFTTKDPHGDLVFTDAEGSLQHPDHPWVHDGICDGARNGKSAPPTNPFGRDCDVNRPDYDKATAVRENNERLTCRSPPLCFKIKVAARAKHANSTLAARTVRALTSSLTLTRACVRERASACACARTPMAHRWRGEHRRSWRRRRWRPTPLTTTGCWYATGRMWPCARAIRWRWI